MADLLKRRDLAVGLGEGVLHTLSLSSTQILRNEQYHGEIPLEVDENYARSKVEQRPLFLVIIDYYSSLKILLCYLISLSSLITIGLSVGMTLYWYERMQNVSYSSNSSNSFHIPVLDLIDYHFQHIYSIRTSQSTPQAWIGYCSVSY